MKNYFTDEQVKKLAWDSCFAARRVLGSEITYEFNESELKALMNLAVEAAIGEAVTYVWSHSISNMKMAGSSYAHLHSCLGQQIRDNSEYTPLYSVKELEN